MHRIVKSLSRNVKKLVIPKSVPNHQIPILSESTEGRYSEVLFKHASKNSKLDQVYSDLELIQNISQ